MNFGKDKCFNEMGFVTLDERFTLLFDDSRTATNDS